VADLLLELFSEEIPARMQADALRDLQNSLQLKLGQPAKGFVTPRRLAVIIQNLSAAQPDVNTELKGPRVGAPEQAIQGFLKKSGLKLEQLEQQDGVYIARIHQKGKPTADVIKEFVEGLLQGFSWPKSMRWGNHDITWVRPLHSILCIFDGKVVPIEFGPVTADKATHGHRFLSPKAITVKHAADYESALEKAHVIADREKRKAEIKKQADALAAKHGYTVKADDGLLEEVTGLVEWPVVLMGSIDAQFMDLPQEVLTTVMKKHQKYFSLADKSGNLAPHFLITANMESKDGGKAIIAGNERVLRARFADARFFWDQDRKKPLSEWSAGLKDVTYHAKLGSVADKVARVRALAAKLAEYTRADAKLAERAAALCKADLVTGMVAEFAELQGIMGRYYALAQGEKPEVADAIRDHYKPQGPNDSVPAHAVGATVALADKLDTLISMFAIGEKPTGSKDPFALRRAALGVIRIILENTIRLPLAPMLKAAPLKEIAIHKAHEKLVEKTEAQLSSPDFASRKVGKYLTVNQSACEDIPEDTAEQIAQSLLAFFHDRLIVQLKDSGIRHDVIKAVTASGDDDLVRIVARAKALQDFLASDDGTNLLVAYRRAANIVAIEEKKDKASYKAAELNPSNLKETEEIALAGLLSKQSEHIENLCREEQFVKAMELLASWRAPVDRFFDKVMVNCEDARLRAERLRLLARIKDSMDSIADFALIEG
jgi:glycyl-tRNA synthetase beta chain